jgi:hypothetical protein
VVEDVGSLTALTRLLILLRRRSVVVRHFLVKNIVGSISRISTSGLCHNTVDLIRDSLVSLSLVESSGNIGITSSIDSRSEGVAESGSSDGIDTINSSRDISDFGNGRSGNGNVDGMNRCGSNLSILFACNRGIVFGRRCCFSFKLFKLKSVGIHGHDGRKSKCFHVR